MTPADDLKIGQYIALVRSKDDDAPSYNPFDFFGGQKRQTDRIDGRPLEIVAISLPFLCVTDGRRRFGIDLRQWDVKRVSRQYAEALWPQEHAAHSGSAQVIKPFRGKRKSRKEKPDKSYCPNCGNRLIQAYSTGSRTWHIICRDCGFNGGQVPTQGDFP